MIVYDASYGIIPLKKDQDDFVVLLIQQHKGYWSFPKGHGDGDETHLESAARELKEETGLTILELVYNEPIVERYVFNSGDKEVHKTVTYFLALVDGVLELQEDEILSAKWVKLKDASDHVTYPEAKALAKQVFEILNDHTNFY